MSLKTRLDSRSVTNNSFKVIDKDGNEILEITLITNGATLEIETQDGAYILKPSGWTSNKGD